MSYYAHSEDSYLVLPRSNQDAALQAVKNLFSDVPKTASILETCRLFGFEPYVGWSTGDIDSLCYEHQRLHCDVEPFLFCVMPFMLPGSYITFIGEDDSRWAYQFDGTQVNEYAGVLTYPGMDMTGPKRNT